MNLTHTKLRSKLAPERVDKLLYVQINRRVLRRDLHAIRKQADEEEVIILEDVDMEDIWGLDDQETEALIGPEVSPQPQTT
jgi:hypothetical protein